MCVCVCVEREREREIDRWRDCREIEIVCGWIVCTEKKGDSKCMFREKQR